MARMDDLRAMGMPTVWLEIADDIGSDAFLRIWHRLDRQYSFQEAGSGEPLRIRLRRFSSYLRYQRNRYIEALAGMGLDAMEIQKRLLAELGEKVGPAHIARIGRGK